MASIRAAIFDLDGVLTDTAELHFRSWQRLAEELRIPFSREINDRQRGLSRPESLAIFLQGRESAFTAAQKAELLDRKNRYYLESVARMTPADLLPGAATLLNALRARGIRTAIASSSRNAAAVIDRLRIAPLLDAIVDANVAPRSKPDPQVFLAAANAVHVPPADCVVLEDAEAGVEAARAAGMRVVGIGPRSRVGRADRVVAGLERLRVDDIMALSARLGMDTRDVLASDAEGL